MSTKAETNTMPLRQTIKTLSLALIVIGLTACSTLSRAQSDTKVVFWNTAEGQQRFARADKTDFNSLVQFFEPQINKFYCGPATAVIVLNALRVPNPVAAEALPTEPALFAGSSDKLKAKMPTFVPVFQRYSQNTFFTANTDKVKTRAAVFGEDTDSPDYGIQLRQLDGMLKAHGLKTQLVVMGDGVDKKAVHQQLVENLKTSGDFVVVNFSRTSLGEKGGGHISPLAAYDAQTDSVLILDVNPTMFAWEWVQIDDLIAAMNTKDVSENRGFISVSEGSK